MTQITAVENKQALKKRVERFFSPQKSKVSASSKVHRGEVYDFVDILTKNTDLGVYAFGGLVRDIGLFSIRKFSSDVDLVIDGSKRELASILCNLPSNAIVKENKFGGFRVKQNQWDFDVWCARDTWAIKNKLVEYENVESLLDTTFLNWDSALFDLRKRKLICHKDYLDNLKMGAIDVVLVESPNELGSVVRLGRAIYSKGASTLRRRAIETLQTSFKKYSIEQILEYEAGSYSAKFLNKNHLTSLRDRVLDVGENVHELNIHKEKQLSLSKCILEDVEKINRQFNSLLVSESEVEKLRSSVQVPQTQRNALVNQLSLPFFD
ncbi:hypothetical protein [Vibrio coralliilyticus]|uniref:Poly A polymerase head domain-containing protein n=1 Tax=Vibrio coralliilyticus TaxID=190893 RepID=A0AAP6ZRH0_9VIBR|nr:hypothetical protein [Vibrio coralliilyticus]NOJ23582.1 hypothetical protein [Vibrio coralliilyticus]